MSQTQQNNQFIKKQIVEGRDHCFKSELPYPKSATRSVGHGQVLVVRGGVVIFNSQDRS